MGYCVPTNSGRVMFCTSEVLLAKIRLNPLLMGEWKCLIVAVHICDQYHAYTCRSQSCNN